MLMPAVAVHSHEHVIFFLVKYDRKYFYRKHLIQSSKSFGYTVKCVAQKSSNAAAVVRGCNPNIQEEGGRRSGEAQSPLCAEFTGVRPYQTNH